MNTSMLTIALASALSLPNWHSDYSTAQQQSSQQNKPLVVLFGPGANGWAKVIRAEGPSAEVTKLLTDHYVCVYVDTSSPEGKRLAQNFEITSSVGVVVSDRKGTTQAFWHQGDLTNASMTHYLQKYADPRIVVNGTETATTPRTSYYPSTSVGTGRTVVSGGC